MAALKIFLVSLLASVLGHPFARRSMKVHETQVFPQGFSQQGPASADTLLNMRIALTPSNREGLLKSVMDVSTPGNALYGKHLTKEEVRATAPYYHRL